MMVIVISFAISTYIKRVKIIFVLYLLIFMPVSPVSDKKLTN